MILAKTRIREQFVKSRRRSISRNTATQREDTDLLTSRARAHLTSRLSFADTWHRYRCIGGRRRCIATAPCDFRVTRAIANGQCISARGGRRKSHAARTRFRAWETRGKGRPDLEDNTGLPIRGSTTRERRKKYIRAPIEAATEALFHKHRQPLHSTIIAVAAR